MLSQRLLVFPLFVAVITCCPQGLTSLSWNAERTQEAAPSSPVRETNKDQHPRGFLLAKNRAITLYSKSMSILLLGPASCTRKVGCCPSVSLPKYYSTVVHKCRWFFSSLSMFLVVFLNLSSRRSKKSWLVFFFFLLKQNALFWTDNSIQWKKAKLWRRVGAESNKANLCNRETKYHTMMKYL